MNTQELRDRHLEGNRKIAEYVKIYVRDFFHIEGDVLGLIICDEEGYFDWVNEGLEFYKPHADWNQLMPVIEKISKVPLKGAEYIADTCYPRTFGMIHEETGDVMVRFNGMYLHHAPTLIEAAWLAVVEFAEMELTELKQQLKP